MKRLLSLSGILIILLFVSIPATAQLMQGGTPEGLKRDFSKVRPEFIRVNPSHIEQFKLEDQITDTLPGIPWRFGESIEVDLSPENSGSNWSSPNGKKIWQTAVYSPGAISLNLVFHPYRVPPGARLFVYTPDGKQILGAFDHRNNQDDGYFATSLLFSDSIIIEYSEPFNAAFSGEIKVAQVTHGYRHPSIFTDKAFGDGGACNVNVACDVAAAYADQIRSVALLLVGSTSFCTGALINNSSNNGTPYILSANHCYRNPATVVFWFNWESETCENPGVPPPHQALSGAVQRSRWAYNNINKTGSDFWLMEMNDLPPYEYNLFYSGWNRTEDPLTIDSVVGIHHPRGDIKKFSWSTDSLQVWGYGSFNQGFDTHWRIKSWDAGTTTEGGSSGSPMMDHQGRIIGQLHGGQAACGNTLPDWYGRFSVSWEGDNIPARQLKVWLDPDNLNPEAIDGFQPVYYFIESSVGAGGGGTIDPSFWVMENRSYTFHIIPDTLRFIEDVLVNGTSVGSVESYTFENVTSEQTIQAIFGTFTYTLTATAAENGSIDPEGVIEVEHGSSLSFTITPDEGFHIEDLLVDGESVGAVAEYSFENIQTDHTIHATFAPTIITYTITATTGENGSIDPEGVIEVEHGSSLSFTITPDEGFHIEDVLVDGESVGAVAEYSFENIQTDHTIHATFAPIIITYTITATAGENGSIDPEGVIEVEQGSSLSFSITPDDGFHIEDVLVDGESVGAVAEFTFENIQTDHTIHALFAITTWSVTFDVVDENQVVIPDAVVTFDGHVNDSGQYFFDGLVPGTYGYEIAREGYFPNPGTVTISSENVHLTVILEIDDTGIIALLHTDRIRVYPNPARETVTVDGPATIERIQLLGTTGAILADQYSADEKIVINIAGIHPGFYLLRIFTQGEIIHRKIQIIP